VVVTINPGAPHAYTIDFTGYVPTSPGMACPPGTTGPTTLSLSSTIGVTGAAIQLPAAPACRFVVEAQKKYVEVTNITLTPVAPCGGSLTFAEGLKSFFGPACVVDVVVSGTVVLKTGVNCAAGGGEPATGTAAPAEFGASALYSCDANGVLSVTGVTGSTNGTANTSLPGVQLGPGATGVGSFVSVGTLGSLCAGSTTGTASVITTTVSGATATLCPTGPGTASLQLCLVGPDGTANSLPNNQPPLCSNTISFSFTLNASRVVPYVRWAGEKVELTKCFGVGLAGDPVEFVLKGNNPGLNATLIPPAFASAANPISGTVTADTIFTTTDARGCATVLGLADGEGAMYVDAAIFNTSAAGVAAGTPLINEHAFEVYYLKFDHVDLENIKFQTYTTAQALTPYLGFLSKTPAFNGASPANASFTLPSPPGTGSVAGGTAFSVPLCSPDFVRAMIHGYFEISGDPSGRPAAQVAISGAAAGSAGSYQLPAGRWVLPEDWPLLATFAGFNGGQPLDITPSSVLAWDLNSGWVYNPTGESPVICGLAAGFLGSGSNGLFLGDNSGTNGATSGTLPVQPGQATSQTGSEDLGPCFGQDAATIKAGSTGFYATAPGSLTAADQALYSAALIAAFPSIAQGTCLGGFTAGFGPFDATRACTDPFPLFNTPAGASVIGGVTGGAACPTGVASPCLAPVNPDSTYLPNGTLNEWDAPMPPAQVSFGITGGPGFLGEVNKTGLYQIRFNTGAGAPCPQGYTLAPIAAAVASQTCQLELDPNPFYAEAIPASPLIPPVTNNGGYLFNSFGFSAGTTTLVSSTGAFGTTAGGFVPGQSTTVTAPATSFTPAACPTLSTTPAAPAPATCTVAGGANLLTPITAGGANSIVVADCRGFLASSATQGLSAEIYSNSNGNTLVDGAPITAVLPTPRTVNGVSYPNACELQFGGNATRAAGVGPFGGLPGALGAPAFSITVIGNQFGLPVPGAGAFQVGQSLTLGNNATPSSTVTSTVAAIDTTNNIVYVNGAEFISQQLGSCVLSRTPQGSNTSLSATGTLTVTPTFGVCEPNQLVAAGTVINSGPVGAASAGSAGSISARPTALYPFWQWVPAAPAATDTPTTATVYSDNHGEAVVTLNTAISVTAVPVNGACTAPFTPIVTSAGGAAINCVLPLSALGTTNIGNGTLTNVKAALAAFSASSPGCIQTFASGTSAALTGVTVGANGPAAGQICVNALGGVEFGATTSLGSTTVQAVADYPYTRGEHPQVASAPLTKVFTSGFAKTLTVSAGTPAPAGTTAYTVTITASDVCGNPITYEPVQVYALGGNSGVVLAPVSVGAVLNASTTSASILVNPAGSATAGSATLSLEVLNTAVGTQGLVVKAVWPFEQIERFSTVIAGVTPGQSVTQTYPPGWNQIGGPSGSNFSMAEALFSYDPASGAYGNATSAAQNVSSAPPGCTGYWAYFAAATAVSLPATSTSGATAACTLAAGYNLVGNPFATPAKLPSGVTAYHWNGTSYDVVNTIGIGQSVWVFNDGTLGSLTLTAT